MGAFVFALSLLCLLLFAVTYTALLAAAAQMCSGCHLPRRSRRAELPRARVVRSARSHCSRSARG